MYFSSTFFIVTLPLLIAAVPLIGPPTSRGIAVPIAKRGGLKGVGDPSKLRSHIKHSIA